jgi:hypothetical protein
MMRSIMWRTRWLWKSRSRPFSGSRCISCTINLSRRSTSSCAPRVTSSSVDDISSSSTLEANAEEQIRVSRVLFFSREGRQETKSSSISMRLKGKEQTCKGPSTSSLGLNAILNWYAFT